MQKTKPRRVPRPARPTKKAKCGPCHKHSYPNEYAAYGAALRRSRHVGPLRVYECPEGHGWHLTSRLRW